MGDLSLSSPNLPISWSRITDMSHKLQMLNGNILRVAFIGKLDENDINQFAQDLAPFLAGKTESQRLPILIDASQQDGRLSPAARRAFEELGNDLRVGNIAIVEANPFVRVFVTFVGKVVREKRGMRAFDNEAEALAWLEKTVNSEQ